jgi:hypothetical protein
MRVQLRGSGRGVAGFRCGRRLRWPKVRVEACQGVLPVLRAVRAVQAAQEEFPADREEFPELPPEVVREPPQEGPAVGHRRTTDLTPVVREAAGIRPRVSRLAQAQDPAPVSRRPTTDPIRGDREERVIRRRALQRRGLLEPSALTPARTRRSVLQKAGEPESPGPPSSVLIPAGPETDPGQKVLTLVRTSW